jgi:superfamily I DNA/RNA helicase
LFAPLLAARFSEVIVDEAQDSGLEELRVLKLLKDWGVALVMVADLDQSIFEFRRADPGGVRAFGNGLGTHLTLDGNYRSSPAICTLNNSLRCSSRKETATGDNMSCTTPVQLLSFRSPGQVAAGVEAILAAHDVPRSDVIFLAHRATDARSCAGSPADSTTHSGNAVLGIAWASRRLRTGSSDGRTRRRAVELIERTLRLVADTDDQTDLTPDDRWLRDAAVRLAVSLDPKASSAKAYALKLREYVANIRWPAGITPRTDLGRIFKAPAQKDWLATSGNSAEIFASATIHSVKGREFPAVVVVLPKNLLTDASNHHGLDHWEQGMPSELRRVLYVGASRAQELLILAAHTDHIDRLTSCLTKDDVPHALAP